VRLDHLNNRHHLDDPVTRKTQSTKKLDSVDVASHRIRRSLNPDNQRERANVPLERDVSAASDFIDRAILGSDSAIVEMKTAIRRLAPSNHSVLILGETGTGKELIARSIHELSRRRSGPLEVLNCAAIPESLAESELFGHVTGAFTGASRNYDGAFLRANGGTLFLDEIGDLSPNIQPKLLRVLETHQMRQVGAKRHIPVDFRVVGATHRMLEKAIEDQTFREDLYHRMSIGVIEVPSLRHRVGDIPELADSFARREARRNGWVKVPKISNRALERLSEYDWPGNVRELRNCIVRAMLYREGVIKARHIEFRRRYKSMNEQDSTAIAIDGRRFCDIKRDIFLRALDQNKGNRAKAADSLGIPKSTFYHQIRVYRQA